MTLLLGYMAVAVAGLAGFYVGRRLHDPRDSHSYQLGYSNGHTHGLSSGLKESYTAGKEDGFDIGYDEGLKAGETATLREVGMVEIPYVTDADN